MVLACWNSVKYYVALAELCVASLVFSYAGSCFTGPTLYAMVNVNSGPYSACYQPPPKTHSQSSPIA